MTSNITNVSFWSIFNEGLESQTMGYTYMVISLLVITSNIIVMVVVVLSTELHSPSLWNIAFMALCDCLYGLYFLTFAVPSAFLNRLFCDSWCHATTIASIPVFLYGQNVLNVLLATFDRCISVSCPLRYPQLMSANRFGAALACTVFVNICRCLLVILPADEPVFSPKIAILHLTYNNPATTFAAIGMPVLTLALICLAIGNIFLDIWRSKKQVQAQGVRCNGTGRQLTVTVVLSASLFCLTNVPLCVSIFLTFKHGKVNVPHLLVQCAMLTLLSNSLWNVVIYAVTYRPFREATTRLFCKTIDRRQRQLELIQTFQIATPSSSGKYI